MIATVSVIGNIEQIPNTTLYSFQGAVYEYNGKKEVQVCQYLFYD
jgi:hypothetical protein